jgi:hypothetical protein
MIKLKWHCEYKENEYNFVCTTKPSNKTVAYKNKASMQ